MCGIVGYIDPSSPGNLLNVQLDCIAHRGPDGEGRFVHRSLHMGMRRLSIIDLQQGWQPLYSRQKRVVAFQNGEIYNYKALRRDLEFLGYLFVTESDTEVLAHGYDAWGIDGLLQRIDGMYAVAIADLDSHVLHLARDRFGEKPLYFAHTPGKFVYASSLKAIATVPWLNLKIDAWSLERYLACHFVSGRRTIIEKALKVLPGERLEIDFDAIQPPRSHQYYRPTLRPSQPATNEEIETLLDQAVESRLVADVPVGLFLSGGIDSSLIAAFAVRRHSDLRAFCIGFDDPDADESQHALAVAKHLDLDIDVYRFKSTHFVELLVDVCKALDEPVGDQAVMPLYWLSREAAKSVKVVLSGEGADELFGGYSYYAPHARDLTHDFARAYAEAHAVNALSPGLLVEPSGTTQSGFPLLTYRHERNLLVNGIDGKPDGFEREVAAWLGGAYDPLQRASAADLISWLPDDLLVKADRMTMAAGLEGRAPFLTPPLAERALCLPVSQKYTETGSKLILRQIAQKMLPASVVNRRKHGFVLPMTRWIDEWFTLNGGFELYMRQVSGLGIDAETLIQMRAHAGDHGRDRLYFAIIVLIEWWRSFQIDVEKMRAQL